MTDLEALEVLVGEWTAEAVDPGSGEPIRGTMTVEWLEGGGYLVQRTTLAWYYWGLAGLVFALRMAREAEWAEKMRPRPLAPVP